MRNEQRFQGTRHPWPVGARSRGLAAGAVLALLVSARPAVAEEIRTVTLTESGPDRELPVGSSFYLSGKASANVTEVLPVYVRYSVGGLFDTSLNSCAQVGAALKRFKGPGGKPSEALRPSTLGVTEVESLWAPPADAANAATYDDIRGDKVFMPGLWQRSPDDPPEATYSILTPKSPFFRVGARYCLFVYETQELPRNVELVEAALVRYGAGWASCEAAKDRGGCQKKVLAELDAALARAAAGVGESERKSVRESAQALLNDASLKVQDNPKSAAAIAGAWGHMINEERAFIELAPVATDPLAGLVVGMLARNDKELLAVSNIKERRVEYVTSDGKIVVKHLGLVDTLDKVRVAENPASREPALRKTFPVAMDKLFFPDSDVSLLDVLQLARGRFKLGDEYVRIAEMTAAILEPVMGAVPGSALAKGDVQKLDEVAGWLGRVNAVIQRGLLEGGRQKGRVELSPSGADEFIYASLGRWLAGEREAPGILRSCSDIARDVSEPVRALLPPCGKAPADAGYPWPGYEGVSESPLGELAGYLRGFVRAVADWDRGMARVVQNLRQKSSREAALPVDIQIGINQKDWFFNYVTPVIGYGSVLRASDPFWLGYIGVQVYFWPNPVDEPMWQNGREDIRRLVGLELGFGLRSEALGPEGRYSGLSSSDLPVVFAGLALQLLPYTTLSAGASFLERRDSTLAQERPYAIVSPYVGVSVQTNVPDIVGALLGRRSSTIASK